MWSHLTLVSVFSCMVRIVLTENNTRLPTDVLPKHYVLELLPLADDLVVLGKAWVHLKSYVATKEVSFNHRGIEIITSSVTLTPLLDGGPGYKIRSQEYDEELEKYTLLLDQPLEPEGQYRLYMRFKSNLSELSQGLYKTNYIDSQTGELKWVIASQFSPTDARSAFPCWDEPGIKAKFTISVGRPSELKSLSNTEVLHTSQVQQMPGWQWDHYRTTPIMSTYLVALLVSEFKNITQFPKKKNLEVRAWGRKEALQGLNMTLDLCPQLVNSLEQYSGIPYVLSKMDIVALPDMGYSAMENWGLLTFREAIISLKEPEDINGMIKAGLILSHEVAHQWFGNLVTPQWWNELWLKEGFATYLGYIILNQVKPSWGVQDRFIINELQEALYADSFKSSRKISHKVQEPKQIRQIFDEISYKKGASILGMLSDFLGEPKFRSGLRKYLKDNEFGVGSEKELWRAMQKVDVSEKVGIAEVMKGWTEKPGYPVLTINRNYFNNSILITQERFLLSGEKTFDDNSTDFTWWIPVSYTSYSNSAIRERQHKIWISTKNKTLVIPNLKPDNWIIFNINNTGYFRVNYDLRNWEMLGKMIHSLPTRGVAALLDDSFSLAWAGRLPLSVPLDLTVLMASSSSSYLPWITSLKHLLTIKDLISYDSDWENRYKKEMVSILPSFLSNLKFTSIKEWKELNIDEKLLSITIIGSAITLGHQKLIEDAKKIFDLWVNGEQIEVISELKESIYKVGIKENGMKEWEWLWNKLQQEGIANEKEKVRILSALAHTKDEKVIEMFLNRTLEDNDLRRADGVLIFASVASNCRTAPFALKFIGEKWDDIQKHFGLGFNRISAMVSSLGKCLNKNEELLEIKRLYQKHKENLGTTEMSFHKTLEKIQINVQWSKINEPKLKKWIQRRHDVNNNP